MRLKLLALLNLISLIVMLAVNAAANIVPINDIMTGAVSDRYPNLFTPAGITFAIWGVIYILLIGFALYGFKLAFGKKKNDQKLLDAVGPWFILSSLLNSLWIFAWHYQKITLSLLLMIALLISLVAMYVNIRQVPGKLTKASKWLIFVPVSVYLGWISIATIANVTIWLVATHWNALSLEPVIWAVIVVAVGLVLAILMLLRKNDYAYTLVVLWAYLGVIIKRIGEPALSGSYLLVLATGFAMLVLLLAMFVKLRQAK